MEETIPISTKQNCIPININWIHENCVALIQHHRDVIKGSGPPQFSLPLPQPWNAYRGLLEFVKTPACSMGKRRTGIPDLIHCWLITHESKVPCIWAYWAPSHMACWTWLLKDNAAL